MIPRAPNTISSMCSLISSKNENLLLGIKFLSLLLDGSHFYDLENSFKGIKLSPLFATLWISELSMDNDTRVPWTLLGFQVCIFLIFPPQARKSRIFCFVDHRSLESESC